MIIGKSESKALIKHILVTVNVNLMVELHIQIKNGITIRVNSSLKKL